MKNLSQLIDHAAARLGSKATKTAGKVRALRGRVMRRLWGSTTPVFEARFQGGRSCPYGWKAYALAAKARKADPEAKAARAGHKRATFLAALTREEKRIIASRHAADTVDKVIALSEEEDKLRARLGEIARLRSVVLGGKPSTLSLPATAAVLLPVSSDSDLGEVVGFAPVQRGKDWSVCPTTRPSYREHAAGETKWKNGKAVGYTRAKNVTHLRAFACVSSDGLTVEAVIHETRITRRAPEGHRWLVDADGLALACGPDEYHVMAWDVLSTDRFGLLPQKIQNQAARRRDIAARALAERATMEGVCVCLADSLSAGNCRAGSLSFAHRLGIEPSKHYSAAELLEMATRAGADLSRLRLAVTVAIRRNRKEVERGYSELAEHTA